MTPEEIYRKYGEALVFMVPEALQKTGRKELQTSCLLMGLQSRKILQKYGKFPSLFR